MASEADTAEWSGDEAPFLTLLRRKVLPAVGPVCIAVLVYVFGSFRLAELVGVKHLLQAVLLTPVVAAALLYALMRPAVLMNPLVAFAIVKLITELAWRADFLYLSEGSAVIAALVVILSASPDGVRVGAKVLVWVAACFATMAAVQWIALFFNPDLGVYRLIVTDDGDIVSGLTHPFSALGLCTDAVWTLLGHPVGRCYSFLREPSLTLVYFFLPAGLALYLEGRSVRYAARALLFFSVIALSGTVWLSMAFGVCWWLLSRVVRVRVIYPYGMIAVAAAYIYYVSTNGIENLLALFASLSRLNGLLARTASIRDRALPALENFHKSLMSPFGSAVLPDASGPWLIHVALAAGWIGLVLLLIFLRQSGRRLDARYTQDSNGTAAFLYCGAMTTTVVFSDYHMISYAGLTLLGFFYRLTEPVSDSHEHVDAAAGETVARADGPDDPPHVTPSRTAGEQSDGVPGHA